MRSTYWPYSSADYHTRQDKSWWGSFGHGIWGSIWSCWSEGIFCQPLNGSKGNVALCRIFRVGIPSASRNWGDIPALSNHERMDTGTYLGSPPGTMLWSPLSSSAGTSYYCTERLRVYVGSPTNCGHIHRLFCRDHLPCKGTTQSWNETCKSPCLCHISQSSQQRALLHYGQTSNTPDTHTRVSSKVQGKKSRIWLCICQDDRILPLDCGLCHTGLHEGINFPLQIFQVDFGYVDTSQIGMFLKVYVGPCYNHGKMGIVLDCDFKDFGCTPRPWNCSDRGTSCTSSETTCEYPHISRVASLSGFFLSGCAAISHASLNLASAITAIQVGEKKCSSVTDERVHKSTLGATTSASCPWKLLNHS